MKKLLLSIGALVMGGVAITAYAFTGEKLTKQVKISINDARTAATKDHPGTIVNENLKKEKSGLAYICEIKTPAATQKVEVDAKTGKVSAMG